MRPFLTCVSFLVLSAAVCSPAQTSSPVTTDSGNPPLPTAPVAAAQTTTPAPPVPTIQAPLNAAPLRAPLPLPAALRAGSDIPLGAPSLTLGQAEQNALSRNPGIAISRLLSIAQGQTMREQRAAELPTLAANITGVAANEGSRITAGALNNPVLYQRAAAGLTLNQLVTDFGRTRNLVASANLRAQAAESTLAATRADIVFAVDQPFYRALGAQALIRLANETVNARQATARQVKALSSAGLRSTLDLSFANAQLAQAQLLVLDARNQSASAQASLSALLG